jgi:hypothetical protein
MKALLVILCPFRAYADADDAKMQRFLSAAFVLDACKEKPSESAFHRGSCVGQIGGHVLDKYKCCIC